MRADIIFYSPSADSAPALSQIKESYQYLHSFLSSIGMSLSSGLKACWGRLQFQQAVKESIASSELIIIMDSYENYPNTAKEIICKGIGCKMVCDEKLLYKIEQKNRIPRSDMTEQLLHISYVPQNSKVFENPVGNEPAILLTAGKQSILILPYQTNMIKAMFESSLSAVCSEIAGYFTETVSFNIADKNSQHILSHIKGSMLKNQKNIGVVVDEQTYWTHVTIKAAGSSPLNAKMLAADSMNIIKKDFGNLFFGTNGNAEEHALTSRMKAVSKKAALFSVGGKPPFSFEKLASADSSESVWTLLGALNEKALIKLGVKKSTVKKIGLLDPLTAVEAASKILSKYSCDCAICFICGEKPAFLYCDKDFAALIKCGISPYQTLLSTLEQAASYNPRWDDSLNLNEALNKKKRFNASAENHSAKDKKKKMPLSSKIALFFASIVFLASAGYIANYFLNSYMNLKSNKDLLSMLGNGEPTVDYPADFDPRFSSLYAINQDVRGVLNIEGTGVDYPVLLANNNDYYLRRDFYKNDNRHGSIFLDCNTDIRTPCSNIVIYGHNMKDGQMFGELLKYEDLEFYKQHPVITFDSVYRPGKYKIISVMLADVSPSSMSEFPYTKPMNSPSPDEMQSFISKIKSRSLINTTVDVQNTDRLLTLSTCDYTFENARFVVVAREVRDGESTDVDVNGASYNQNPVMP